MNRRNVRKQVEKFRLRGWPVSKIAKHFNIPKGTIWGWVKHLPINFYNIKNLKLKNRMYTAYLNKKRYENKRQEAYNEGVKIYKKYKNNNEFKLFIMLYMCEGYRKNINVAQVCNSNPVIMRFAYKWMKKFSNKLIKFRCGLQYHKDQNSKKLIKFWCKELKVNKNKIKIRRKSNSGKLDYRKWASEYGVCSVEFNDTYLRSKIQAWMDILTKELK
jgi:hypothetical protein